MATYKEIKGVTVQTLDSDPVLNVGTWSSGGSLNAGRTVAGFGTQTASVAAGSTPPTTSNVEEYDGTSWTEVNNLPTAVASNAGAGIITSGLSFGGYTPSGPSALTEEYN